MFLWLKHYFILSLMYLCYIQTYRKTYLPPCNSVTGFSTLSYKSFDPNLLKLTKWLSQTVLILKRFCWSTFVGVSLNLLTVQVWFATSSLFSLQSLVFFFFFSNLYSTFQSPWADAPCRPQDIDFHVPSEYLTNIYIRDKLAPIKLNRYGEDLLFFLFYMNGGDVLQLAAAAELWVLLGTLGNKFKVLLPNSFDRTRQTGQWHFCWPKCWEALGPEFNPMLGLVGVWFLYKLGQPNENLHFLIFLSVAQL